MSRTLIAVALSLVVPLPLFACLWDRDTPANEARGLPEVVPILTGRFERNPPLYYELRLARVTAEIESHPEELSAYDDAAVSCDRLGRGDEAIAWMEKKLGRLKHLDGALPGVKDQFYRYHANLGTFLVHRWVRQGADRSKIDEVKSARDQIAKAIQINPNAHFGREIYQLQVLDWILNPPTLEGSWDFPNILGWSFDDIYGESTEPKEADAAVRGLTGLVVLGNAWESVDVFHALNIALQRDSMGYPRGREGGRNALAYLAWLRCRELIKAGKGSLLPDAPRGEPLMAMLRRPDFVMPELVLDPAFQKLRSEADAWHAARTAFMNDRLKQGHHPDTDPTFWDGYTERLAPALPAESIPDAFHAWIEWRQRLGLALFLGILLAVAVLTWAGVRHSRKARAQKPRRAQAVLEDL